MPSYLLDEVTVIQSRGELYVMRITNHDREPIPVVNEDDIELENE